MDYSKTQVFNIKGANIEQKASEREFVEKDVQNFYEKNLEELLGCELIESEYSIEGGRLDTFAIDKDNRPVIIEYKRTTKDSVLLQALFYKDYIRKNWEKAYLTIMDKKGKEIADEIDFTNIRVVIIAQTYDKWTVSSTTFLDGVELYSFAFYQDTFIQEFLNEPKSKKRKTVQKITKGDTSNNYVSVLEADYSVDEFVITKGGKQDTTNIYKYNRTSDYMKEVYEMINEYIEEKFPQTEIIYNKDYWFFKSKKKYLEIIFQKDTMKMQINLPSVFDKGEFEVNDLRNKGSWGSLDFSVKFDKKSNIDKLFEYIDASFIETNTNF